MMNTAIEPATLIKGVFLATNPASFCPAPMNSEPHVKGIYFTANRVKVWSGKKSKDAIRE
jgi:hypothetical protein